MSAVGCGSSCEVCVYWQFTAGSCEQCLCFTHGVSVSVCHIYSGVFQTQWFGTFEILCVNLETCCPHSPNLQSCAD